MSRAVEKKLWKQQPMRACSGAISSWDAGVNVTGTVASSVGCRRTLALARLQTSCSEPLPNQFFDALPTRTGLHLCGLQETVTAANLRASFTKTLKISTLATIEGLFFFSFNALPSVTPFMNGRRAN